LLKDQFGEQEVQVLEKFDYADAAKQAARYAGTPRPTGCI
jgi:sulfur relay (sulfurtransferase) DsrC/TusE family protein